MVPSTADPELSGATVSPEVSAVVSWVVVLMAYTSLVVAAGLHLYGNNVQHHGVHSRRLIVAEMTSIIPATLVRC
ncbi:hypothetical protein GCM10009672_20480 [Nesterenkonia lutea]